MRKTITLIAIFIIFILATSACQGDKKSGDVLFSDDFSSDTNGWTQVEDTSFTTKYNNGAYQIIVHQTMGDAWGYPVSKTFADVQVEVDATKNSGPDDNDFGVICRYLDTTHFYFAAISSDGYYGIMKMSEGQSTVLGREDLIPSELIVQGASTNHIRFDCNGPILTLYINGTQLDQQVDEDYVAGNVGLFAGTYDVPGTDILFDNFIVYQP